MKILGFNIGREARANVQDPGVPVSSADFLSYFGLNSVDLPNITVDSALRVPAVTAAVAFLSRTLAALPKHVYRRTDDGDQRVDNRMATVIATAPNDITGAFKFWQYFWQQVFTGGRGLAWIERSGQTVSNLWNLEPGKTTITRDDVGRIVYKWDGHIYPAADVIDICFMPKPNMLGHYGPISNAAKAIQLALAMNDYASQFFAGGGVPPLALVGPLPAGREAQSRALNDISRAIDVAKSSSKPIFPMPPGHELKPVGFDPEKGQMTEARQYQVVEIARAWQLPPVFLQDLTHGTFSNTEQQDLHLVKHLVAQWAKALEDEMNLKIFGRFSNSKYIEHNLDALMRGDFKSRIEALAQGVQNALLTPNEGRAYENRPALENGDKLYIQGATVPLGTNNGGANDPGNPDAVPQA